jgi:hypothetical protein
MENPMQDRNVDNRLTDLNRRKSGMRGGTIAAIIAALIIIAALYTWGPGSTDSTTNAANPAPATTVGQGSAAPAATTPATPAPTTR